MDVRVEIDVYELNGTEQKNLVQPKLVISAPRNWQDKMVNLEFTGNTIQVNSRELENAIAACRKASRWA